MGIAIGRNNIAVPGGIRGRMLTGPATVPRTTAGRGIQNTNDPVIHFGEPSAPSLVLDVARSTDYTLAIGELLAATKDLSENTSWSDADWDAADERVRIAQKRCDIARVALFWPRKLSSMAQGCLRG